MDLEVESFSSTITSLIGAIVKDNKRINDDEAAKRRLKAMTFDKLLLNTIAGKDMEKPFVQFFYRPKQNK